MRKRKLDLVPIGLLVSTLVLAGPIAAAADVFAYRTEDGVFAYTDDRDKVPARYADDVVTVPDPQLRAYPRLTVEDSNTARAVTSRLEKRLDYLRQVNASSPSARPAATAAGRSVVSVPVGFAGALGDHPGQRPTLDIASDASDEPIVVEEILTKEHDRVRTRRATIVRQGDRVLSVIMGRSHHVNPSDDIHDEDHLLDPR